MSAVFEEIVEQERARSFTEGEIKGRKEGRNEGLEIGLKNQKGCKKPHYIWNANP